MRVTFNPVVSNMTPIKPIQRIVRKNTALSSDPVQKEMELENNPVQSQISGLGLMKSQEDVEDNKPYKKNPIWNVMLNI